MIPTVNQIGRPEIHRKSPLQCLLTLLQHFRESRLRGQQRAVVVVPLLRLPQLEEAHLRRRRRREVSWTVGGELGEVVLLRQRLRDHGELLPEILMIEQELLYGPSGLSPDSAFSAQYDPSLYPFVARS